ATHEADKLRLHVMSEGVQVACVRLHRVAALGVCVAEAFRALSRDRLAGQFQQVGATRLAFALRQHRRKVGRRGDAETGREPLRRILFAVEDFQLVAHFFVSLARSVAITLSYAFAGIALMPSTFSPFRNLALSLL